MVVFSEKELPLGKCSLVGIRYSVADRRKLGEEFKNSVNLDVFFLNEHIPFLPKLENPMEVRKEFDSHDKLMETLLGKRRHPKWFEQLICAILFSWREYGYPTHFLMIGIAGTGKSKLLDSLRIALDEVKAPVSGSTSTMKGLIPSFHTSPPSPGHLCESERVALVDALLTFIPRRQTSYDEGSHGNLFQLMKDLLEHDEREAASGTGRTRVKMSSTMFAVTNPTELCPDVPAMARNLDNAWLSRFLIYAQTDQHIEFVNKNKSVVTNVGEKESFPVINVNFIALYEWLKRERIPDIDVHRARAIFDKYKKIVPVDLNEVYGARYDHHILNLISGVCKYRWLIGEKEKLEFDEEDYELAEELFANVIITWGDIDLANFPERVRLGKIDLVSRKVYDTLCSMVKSPVELSELAKYSSLEVYEVGEAISKLMKAELVKIVSDENGKFYVPFWYERKGVELGELKC